MSRTLTSVWFAFLVVFPCFVLGDLCQSRSRCRSCAHEKVLLSSDNCRWCELDRGCHTSLINDNPCKNFMDITNVSECPPDSEDFINFRYDPTKALFFAQLSAVAYTETNDLESCFKSLVPEGGVEFIKGIGRQCNINNMNYKDCFAFIAVSNNTKDIVISFRGTADGRQLEDEKSNFDLEPFKKNFMKVNKYFKNAFLQLYDCILYHVKQLLVKYSDYNVVVTGHSLGGAIASLAAFYLVTEGIVSKERLFLYTYGLPRVGNKEYAYYHDKFVPNSWRVIHDEDAVVGLPPFKWFFGYYHHRTPIHYPGSMGPNALYKMYKDNEDSRISGYVFGSNSDHLYYFGIRKGLYCERRLGRKRSTVTTQFQWPEDRCLAISPGDANAVTTTTTTPTTTTTTTTTKTTTAPTAPTAPTSTAWLNLMYKPLLYTNIGVLVLALRV